MKFSVILSFVLFFISLFYSLNNHFNKEYNSVNIIFAQDINALDAPTATPTSAPTQLGTITKFCLGEGSDAPHKTATTLCLPWDNQISSPISGVGRSVGEHYCCELCNPTSNSWANTCYRPIDKNKNTRGPGENTCEINAGVAFPLKCKTDPTDNVNKWISQNDVGECNIICAVTGITGTPTNTPPPGQPTNSPTPTQSNNSCPLDKQTPPMMPECINCIYNRKDNSNFQDLVKFYNDNIPKSCTPNQFIQHWCNGGVSTLASEDCDRTKKDAAKCGKPEYKCSTVPTVPPSPTPTPNNTSSGLDCSVIPPKLLSDKCSLCMFDALQKASIPLKPNNLCNASQNVINYCKDIPTVQICMDKYQKECLLQCSLPDTLIITKSYSNSSYEMIMDNYRNGQLSAIEISAYVAAANRVPGIQMRYCDPFKGECDLIIDNLL